MKIVADPFGNLQSPRSHELAVAGALQGNAAAYIRFAIAQQLAEIEPTPEHPFARGYRMGLRVAYLGAGGLCDGSEENWAAIVEAARD